MVQDMVGGQTIEVARGRNCYGLCWSPDGAELAYYGQKSDETWATWIVPRLGGTARELDEVSVVAWSPDGTRLGHWSDEKKQLLIVNRTTGESQPVSTDKKLPPYAEDLDWSPSGKLIVLSMYDENDKYSIWIVSVDGLRQQMILEDPQFWGGTPRWSPRGDAIYYLLEREQTTSLWKVPVSPDSGKPMKPPLPVLEGHQIGSYFTITNDGKKLAYTRETGNNNLWLASIEGSGKSQRADVKPLTRGTLNSSSPNFSPDGKSIVCVRGADKTDVYVMPAEGGTARRLTFLDAWVGGPVWSPEGNEIAFFGAQGEEPVRIWKVDTAGGQPRKFDRAEGMWPGWAPGPKVLYQTYTRLNLMALDPATGEVASLLKEDADWLMVWPTWSPDGKRIALRWKKGPESQAGLWLFSPGDSSLVLLRKGPAMPSGWSADGKWIYAWEPVSGGGDILAISPENGQAEVLCHVPLGPEIGRVWLPPNTVDGRHFVVTGHTSPSDVWIMEHFDPDIK